MKYLSVCSGIEAATTAWHSFGWKPMAFSEIEPFPSAVLTHHYPQVPNLGDMTKYEEWPNEPVDLLVGGTPCQSFSVAGLRKGLDDPRGNLMLTFGAIARKYRPRWLVWENVPGVLSSNGGRDFGTFLGMLGELGYGFAYRVLDAQYFGVAQRRRRVFVVGCFGNWRAAAAVLFERHSLQGHPAPRRETGEKVANALTDRADRGGTNSEGQRLVAQCLTAGTGQRFDPETETILPVVFDWQSGGDARGLDPKDTAMLQRNQVPAVVFSETADCLMSSYSTKWNGNASAYNGSLYAMQTPAVAHAIQAGALRTNPESGPGGVGVQADHAYTLEARAEVQCVQSGMQVRRLTPRECERLQGFPDDYTLIPWRKKSSEECPDGPRYKALGNSMAVPVMRWIGERINLVETLAPKA